MKKMSWGRILVIALSLSTLLTACAKDGENGKDGTNGTNGATGTANVIYSAWLDVTFALNADTTAFLATINAPKLVDSILQKGEMKVYIRSGSPTNLSVFPLPYFDGSDILNVSFQATKINLVSITGDFSTHTTSGVKLNQFRYILIPGGVLAGRSMTVDWNNYPAVKEYLGLKD